MDSGLLFRSSKLKEKNKKYNKNRKVNEVNRHVTVYEF